MNPSLVSGNVGLADPQKAKMLKKLQERVFIILASSHLHPFLVSNKYKALGASLVIFSSRGLRHCAPGV